MDNSRPQPRLGHHVYSTCLLRTLGVVAAFSLLVTLFAQHSMPAAQVRLVVDGAAADLTTHTVSVGELLERRGVTVSAHDVLVPDAETLVTDGMQVTVRRAHLLRLVVDGQPSEHWVTQATVGEALENLGVARSTHVSRSRTTPISASGLLVDLTTIKKVHLLDGAADPREAWVAAANVQEALEKLEVHLGVLDRVDPGPQAPIRHGEKITVTRVEATRHVLVRKVAFKTKQKKTSALKRGQKKVVRTGKPGKKRVVVERTAVNGKHVKSEVLLRARIRHPQHRVVAIGTARSRKPDSKPDRGGTETSRGSVWDRLAQCESGGNWAINTGNGYYGGLQFLLSTWRAYGGTGYPHKKSREAQIAVAVKLRDANGGSYGSWPACASKLGLPR